MPASYKILNWINNCFLMSNLANYSNIINLQLNGLTYCHTNGGGPLATVPPRERFLSPIPKVTSGAREVRSFIGRNFSA